MTRRKTARERLRGCSDEAVREQARYMRGDIRTKFGKVDVMRAVVAWLDEEMEKRRGSK